MRRATLVVVVLLVASTASAHPLDLAALRLQPVGDDVDVAWDLTLLCIRKCSVLVLVSFL